MCRVTQGDAAHVLASLAQCCVLLYIQTPVSSLWQVLLPSAKSDPSRKYIQNQGLLSMQLSVLVFPYKLPVKCRFLYFLKASDVFSSSLCAVCAREISSGAPEQKACWSGLQEQFFLALF